MAGFLRQFADRYLRRWCEILIVEVTTLVILWVSMWLFAVITE